MMGRTAIKAHGRPLAVLTLFALVLAWLATHAWHPTAPHLRLAPARAISGDEPHYLLLVNSALYDGDLLLQNNYAAVRQGACDAGHRYRGIDLDPHVLLVSRETGETWLWQKLYSLVRVPEPDAHGFCFQPQRVNPLPPGTYDWVPAHAPAYPVVVAALLKPWSLSTEQLEFAFGLIVLCLAIAALFAAYGAGLAAGLSPRESVIAVALFAFCSPWLAYTRSFYTGMPVTLLLLLGLWAHLRGLPVATALSLAGATWLKPSCAVLGMIWIVERLWQRRLRDAFVLMAVQGVSGLLLIAFNLAVSGLPVIAGSSPMPFRLALSNAFQILFSPGYGLASFAPWVLLALIAPFVTGPRKLAPPVWRALLLPLGAHALLMSGYATLGSSFGPRYWIFVLPWLAVLAVAAVRGRGVLAWGLLGSLALMGAACAVPAVLQYDVGLWGQPPHTALWRMLGW